MKSQLLGWNKQQVDHYLKELQTRNEQQLLADAEMINQVYADLSAVHREMLEASQQLVLAREQAKKLEDIDKVTLMMKDKLVKEAEAKAHDMIAAAYEEALEHRKEIESIRSQIKTLSNEYKQMVNQIQERIGVQMQIQPSSNGKDQAARQAMAATRDDAPESDHEHELEVVSAQNNKVINFIRPFQAGSQRFEDTAPQADKTFAESSFFDPEPDFIKLDITPEIETKEIIPQDIQDLSGISEPLIQENFELDLALFDTAAPGADKNFHMHVHDAAMQDVFNQAEEMKEFDYDTPEVFYQDADSLDVASLDLTAERAKLTTEAAATQPEYIPARPSASASLNNDDPLLHRGLDEKQALYIIGNMAGADLVDDDGQLIIAKGNTITPEIVNRAFVAGKLIDLVINMELPGFDEPQT